MWWDVQKIHPQSSVDPGSYLTYHDTKGKNVHLFIITFPCKVEEVWAAFLVFCNNTCWMCLVTILVTMQIFKALAMYHLRRHPVGVSYDRVTLPAVRFAEFWQWSFHWAFERRRFALILLLHHQPGQTEICHHHRLVLTKTRQKSYS